MDPDSFSLSIQTDRCPATGIWWWRIEGYDSGEWTMATEELEACFEKRREELLARQSCGVESEGEGE